MIAGEPVEGREDGRPRTDSEHDESLIRALPGLVRIAGAAWWRTTGWTVNASLRVGTRVFRAAVSGEAPAELLREGGTDLRAWVRRILEIAAEEDDARRREAEEPEEAPAAEASLRKRGEELLRRSADVNYVEDEHPAFASILDQLAPDEGRILRLLALEGPQAAVDIRTGGPLGVVGSDLIAPGLTMIGQEAGCRRLDRVHSYLNNLERLGLIWFSRETLGDQSRYQVLEAQPQVVEAMETAGRGRIIRRSIHLTPFGEDFCETCLPFHTAELDALPGAGGGPGDVAPEAGGAPGDFPGPPSATEPPMRTPAPPGPGTAPEDRR